MKNIYIIGNGISGVTAARHLRKKSEHQITLISEESEYFFSRTALMYSYMGHMQWKDLMPYPIEFWKKNRIDLLKTRVLSIDFKNQNLMTREGQNLNYDILILATGSTPNLSNWPRQNLTGVGCLYHQWDLQKLEEYSKNIQQAVITGGGLIGIEMAEMLHSRQIQTTMLVREKEYWSNVLPLEEAQMISAHIRRHGIDLKLQTQLKEIKGSDKVTAVVTDQNDEISCQWLGLTIGVRPNIDVFKNTELEIDRGILVDAMLKTNIPNVFAIGDCAQQRQAKPGRKDIEAVWYTGRIMGKTVASVICGERTEYDPGIWFNSAKFFDIEYQVYGEISSSIQENVESIFWRHPTVEKSIRINFDRTTKKVLGFNLMGIRFRQEVCERWINQKTDIQQVLQNIRLAFFDPEFFEDCSNDFIQLANQKTGMNIHLNAGWELNEVLNFLKN